MGASIRAESIARLAHLRVEYGGEYLYKGLLDDAVNNRRYSQFSLPSIGFRDALSPYVLWLVAAL